MREMQEFFRNTASMTIKVTTIIKSKAKLWRLAGAKNLSVSPLGPLCVQKKIKFLMPRE
jgi:hypothetical protein